MRRRYLLWLTAIVALIVAVAVQTVVSSHDRAEFIAEADVPTVVPPGTDVLAGIPVIPLRIRGHDYRRAAFGDSWTDDTSRPAGTTAATPATTSSTATWSTRRSCRSSAVPTPLRPAR